MPNSNGGDVPPTFRIDLSLPPSSRYVALAHKYRSQLRELMPLFTALLEDVGIPRSLVPLIQGLAKLCLRRLYSSEENLELRGISKVTQVPMFLVVSFNVLLDLLMGCTSGAAKTLGKGRPICEAKMLHFRTLDWDMDPLRDIIVQLHFVKSASATPDKVLATSLTYIGYIGVLTGVRPGLSMSLNFRPQHKANNYLGHVLFYAHNLLVLLGRRQSISSLLRSCLFSDDEQNPGRPISLDDLAKHLPSKPSTAAYLVFSDGKSAMTIEKDRVSGEVRKSNSFLVMTNHDLDTTSQRSDGPEAGVGHSSSGLKGSVNGSSIEHIISESTDRRACMLGRWTSKVNEEREILSIASEKSSASLKGGPTLQRGRGVDQARDWLRRQIRRKDLRTTSHRSLVPQRHMLTGITREIRLP